MTRCIILLLTVFSFLSLTVTGQVGVDYDLQNQKPARFENRTLASEKSNDGKKFKMPRHFIQNTVTHYNFFFNANNKLNEVIASQRGASNRLIDLENLSEQEVHALHKHYQALATTTKAEENPGEVHSIKEVAQSNGLISK